MATSGHGGRRPGAGRPRGARSVLPQGAVGCIKAARASRGEDPHGDEAFGVVLAVMRGEVHDRPSVRLQAAREVLDRALGRPTQPVRHEGLDGLGARLMDARAAARAAGDEG